MDIRKDMLEYYGMSESEIEITKNCYTIEKIDAKQFFLEEGSISDKRIRKSWPGECGYAGYPER